MKTEINPKKTNAVILRVTDNDEYFDESADFALIEITPELKETILKARENLAKIKKEIGSEVYDIRIFDHSPDFYSMSSLEDIESMDLDLENKIYDKGIVFVNKNIIYELSEADKVRTDVSLLQVKEDAFFWTGYYKHTTVRYQTEALTFEQLEAMKI